MIEDMVSSRNFLPLILYRQLTVKLSCSKILTGKYSSIVILITFIKTTITIGTLLYIIPDIVRPNSLYRTKLGRESELRIQMSRQF